MNYSILALLLLAAASTASAQRDNCVQPGFKQGAEQFVRVSYGTKEFRRVVSKDVTQAEVVWSSNDMLADPGCHDLTKTALLLRPVGLADWVEAEAAQRPGSGQESSWRVDVKPCLEYEFAIRVGGQEEAVLELPVTLGPASAEEVAASGYAPEAPKGFHADVGAHLASVEWEASDCATDYDVYVKAAGAEEGAFVEVDGTGAQVNDLEPCTSYEVAINAYLGNQVGTYEGTFATM